MTIDYKRRIFLKALTAAKILPTPILLNLLGRTENSFAQGGKKYLITVQSVFCLRVPERTNFTGDLAPLAPYQNMLKVVGGLHSEGKGDEYHGGKQKRFGTSCTPIKGTHTTMGGGAFDGASFDVVVGRHQKNILKTKEDFLVLGTFPYTDCQTTFESFSFVNKSQYVPPTYDFNRVINDIKKNVNICATEKVKLDVNQLKLTQQILRAVEKEYGVESQRNSGIIKDQLVKMQGKYGELIKAQEGIIKNGGYLEGDCFEMPSSPSEHLFVGNAPWTEVPQAFEAHVRKMNYIAANALASNYTASVTLNYNFSGHGQANVPPYHGCTHASFVGVSQERGNQTLDALTTFQINMLSHLFKELKRLNILDQTIVIYTPHERPTHGHPNTPVLATGFGTGIYNRGLWINDFAADVLNAFKVPNANNFGGERSKGGVLV